jgi:hypothetical protein
MLGGIRMIKVSYYDVEQLCLLMWIVHGLGA